MKSEKQKKPVRLLHTNLAHWKAKVAVTLAVVVSAVNITPAAMLGTPSHREKAIKVTFQSGDNGYFAGISDEDLKSTKSNATKSNADRTEWVQTFSDLEEDDQGYFTNLKLGAEEVEAKNQKPVWETVKNQANENNSDADDLHFAGWYSYDSKYPVKVGNYKEIYGNTTLKAEWYAPNQIKGKAKDKYKMIAVGLEERKLIASEVNKEQDIAELMEWAGEALLKEKLQADGEKVFAMELEIEEDKKAEQKKAITLTLSVQKEQLEFTKQVSVIHERENGKIEIIPADIVKSDNGDDYWVTFTTNSQGAFYFINTCNYRRTAFLSQARANTDTSGTIGKDITWKIENKTLTISGKGEMPDWKFATTPWYGSRENIEEVIIGKGITRIGEYAFYLFSNMTKVQIPEGVTSIGSYAFAYNTNLTDIMIPESIKDIDSTVFDNCGKLPDSVIIGKGSLGESDSIKWKITKKGDLTIGGTGPMPDLYSFEAPWNPHTAYKINSVIIEEGVTKIGDYLFYMCDQLTSVKIAETVLQIGESAFAGCTKLTDIIIPESVISIERFAFSNTGITSVTIPKAVEFLGQKSFPKGTQITFSKKEEAGEALKLTGNINFVGIDNEHKQDYRSYSSTVINSYLYEGEAEIFYRVEYTANQVVIEQYKADYTFIKSWNIPMELPKFGGFYAGSDAFYIVFGQDNKTESDDVEVVRVVKYSKDMKRLSSVSLYGANTLEPFHFSNLRMEEKEKYLYIRTGHTMYKSQNDGLNHQANMTLILDTEGMVWTYQGFLVTVDAVGYTSHSFNQFVRLEDDKMITIDQGDKYPRGVVMTIAAIEDVLDNPLTTMILPITEEANTEARPYQYTGISLGGFEISDSSYLIAGNTIDREHFATSETRNIFLSVVDKNALDSEPKYMQITDYEEGNICGASTPQLVKISENLFAVMWEEVLNTSTSWNLETNGKVKVAFFDGEGNQLGDKKIEQFEGALSDCQPIVLNGNITWYVSDGSDLTFYSFPAQEPDFSSGIKADKTTLTKLERSLMPLTAEPGKITENSIELNTVEVSPKASSTDGKLEYGFTTEMIAAKYGIGSRVRNLKDWKATKLITSLRGSLEVHGIKMQFLTHCH